MPRPDSWRECPFSHDPRTSRAGHISAGRQGAGYIALVLVECEPIGLLEQREGQEIDHKIVAALPGQHVVLSQTLLQELQDFIYAVFAEFPDEDVRVGPILPREAALKHIQTCREA